MWRVWGQVSLSVDVAFANLEAGLSAELSETAEIGPGPVEVADSVDLAADAEAGGAIVIIAVIASVVVCVCCGLPMLRKTSAASMEAKQPNNAAANDRSGSRRGARGDAEAVADDPFGTTTYGARAAHAGQSMDASTQHQHAQQVSLHAEMGTSASGRVAERDVKAHGQANERRRNLSLAEAVFCGQATAIAQFARDVNEKVQGSFTPLYIAARNNDVASVKQLLHYGADVNASTRGGSTALCRAAQGGNAAVLRVMLEHPNIEINKQRGAGRTALFLAVQNGHQECVQLLLDNGAAVNLSVLDPTNQKSWTAQQYADRRATLALASSGASSAANSERGQAQYATIAAMLRANSLDDVQSRSDSSKKTTAPAPAALPTPGGGGGGGGFLPPPPPPPAAPPPAHATAPSATPAAASVRADARGPPAPAVPARPSMSQGAPVVPRRDHGDLTDSGSGSGSSSDSDSDSTGGVRSIKPAVAPIPPDYRTHHRGEDNGNGNEPRLASLMTLGVAAVQTSVPAPVRVATSESTGTATAMSTAPVIPPRTADERGMLLSMENDTDTDSDTSSERCTCLHQLATHAPACNTDRSIPAYFASRLLDCTALCCAMLVSIVLCGLLCCTTVLCMLTRCAFALDRLGWVGLKLCCFSGSDLMVLDARPIPLPAPTQLQGGGLTPATSPAIRTSVLPRQPPLQAEPEPHSQPQGQLVPKRSPSDAFVSDSGALPAVVSVSFVAEPVLV